jgi:sulfatase modifying factor 1
MKMKYHRRVKPAQRMAPPAPLAGRQKLYRYSIGAAFVLVLAGLVVAGFAGDWFGSSGQKKDEDLGEPRIYEAKAPGSAPEGMVWIPGGVFWMGDDGVYENAPWHKVSVDGFWMDKTEVTNADFAKFVKATSYLTVAERRPDPKDFPNIQPQALGFEKIQPPGVTGGTPTGYSELLASVTSGNFPSAVPWGAVGLLYPIIEPFSLVFWQPPIVVNMSDHNQWWKPVVGASWRRPEGPDSDIKDRLNHPVVHICYEDALAYCNWRSKTQGAAYRLPTEAEWEFAARGGLDRKTFSWGDELYPEAKAMANIWEGKFPASNTLKDGHYGTAPVGSYPPNGFGLHDMAGNVWEWCADWYQPDYYAKSNNLRDPQGPLWSFDPHEGGTPKRVQRGGSYLCCDNYCARYIMGTRGKGEPTSAQSHAGFRCVRSP